MKKNKRALLLIGIVLCVAVFVYSGFLLARYYFDSNAAVAEQNSEQQYDPKLNPPAELSSGNSMPNPSIAQLKTKEPDAICWLTIPGTKIDYPVVLGADDEYYIDHSAEKKPSVYGAIFMNYLNSADFSDFNTIIFGHNMKNGSMFQALVKFKDKSFWDSHQEGTLYTEDKTYKLQIFACGVVDGGGESYDTAFSSQGQEQEFLDYVKSSAMYYRDIGVTTQDHLLTLSTCSYEHANARTVIVAKLVEQMS